MGYKVSEMEISDYDAVVALWEASEAIALSSIDSRECIQKFLEANMGLSFVARTEEEVVGAVLCSQDGRLGYLSNLIIAPAYRRQGIGRQLVGRCMYALMGMGIHHCILLIFRETEPALQFWQNVESGGRVKLVQLAPREK
ncbi:MAG TPA: GNAT family N-acetyltransferase [Anaerolineales bacterium]|nr:GNAT family N-acetyltransferase [Anaerolineales bacterium]